MSAEPQPIFGATEAMPPFDMSPYYDVSLIEKFLKEFFLHCVEYGVSDIRFVSDSPVLVVCGGRNTYATDKIIAHSWIEDIVNKTYGPTGSSSLTTGYDLNYAYEIRNKEKKRIRFRINGTAGRNSVNGQDAFMLAIRTIPDVPPSFQDLGVEEDIIENIRPRNGVAIVAGETGSGKSTLLSAVYRHLLEQPGGNEQIVEYGMPIEHVYDEVKIAEGSAIFQTELGKQLRPKDVPLGEITAELLCEYSVVNAVRRNPTTIGITEAKSAETLASVISAATSGHMVYTTFHARSVADTILRSILMFRGGRGEEMAYPFLSSLGVMVHQDLLPRIGGGRVAAREYLVVTDDVRDYLMDYPPMKWGHMLQRAMDEGRFICRSNRSTVQALFDDKQIDERVFKQLMARYQLKEEAA